jgi:M6 family metalloprotease-like protein
MTVELWLLWVSLVFFITPLLATPVENSDTIKILAIRVEFQPDDASTTTGDGTFDLSSGNVPFQIDPPPHNRSYFKDHLLFLKNYFVKISRGALLIEGEVFPVAQNSSYRLDHPMTYYNPNTTPDEINQQLATLFYDAIQKADQDPDVTFSQYDAYIVFHAGVGRDIDFGLDETPQDIPSLFITQRFLQTHLGIDGIPVDGGAGLVKEGSLLPETESQEGLQLGLNGMVVSNFGSQLGWLDLFSPDIRRSGVGRFALMDAGLFNGDGLVPALPMAWTRIDAGWETPVTVYQAQDEEFEIHSILSDAPGRVYKFPINENEYFLLENRYAGEKSLESLQLLLFENRDEFPSMREVLETYYSRESEFSDSTGVLVDIDNPDRGLPGGLVIAQNDTILPGGAEVAAGDTIWYGTGVLIWHIDENIIAQKRRENRINADPDHRGVDVEEADGSQDIGEEFQIISGGAGSEIGTVLDAWYADNPAPVFIRDPRNEFSINSTPNSRSYYNRADSHIKLYEFSRLDTLMTFNANLNFFQANFPRRIDTVSYGKVTSLKVADPDGNGAEELIMTTDQNKVLVVNQEGQAGWGSDSLEIISLPESSEIVTPPAVFRLSDLSIAIVVLTNWQSKGTAYGFRFNIAEQRVDSLFQFQISDSITTFPIVAYQEGNPNIFWGSSGGKIYLAEVGIPGATLSEISGISEPIKFLHILSSAEIISTVVAVTRSGMVYLNQTLSPALSPGLFQPVGDNAVSVTREGIFFQFTGEQYESPEDGIHRFDSPLIAISQPGGVSGLGQETYLSVGDNQARAFNNNFTPRTNFPVKLYNPAQPTELFLSPLVGYFPANRGEDEAAVIVGDPGGMISGFDLRGNPLPDFPLAIGDSLAVSPALLDIDGDEDLELACVTANGTVYAWDFASRIDENTRPQWPQLYATPENSNLSLPVHPGSPGAPAVLLPSESVYNYPNPNNENYTFIRYRLTEEAEVRIKIFDLAGDLVKELEGTGYGHTDNEVRWDLTGVQSGVYIGRVEARSNTKSEVQIIKIAVVK